MPAFIITFAGSSVSITWDDPGARRFLSFLFGDLARDAGCCAPLHTLSLLRNTGSGDYLLVDGDRTVHRGALDVGHAAALYDRVIFHLLDGAGDIIALHAGAVARSGRVMLLPGVSGAGKSSLTMWLTAIGCSYLSDELIAVSLREPDQVFYFSRPICLKPGSIPLIKQVSDAAPSAMLLDESGAVLPHRLLNPDFKPVPPSPAIILFPDHQTGRNPCIEPISAARAATRLMGCLVNARNLENHGFSQIIQLAGSTASYRLRYRTFQEAEHGLKDLLLA